MEAQIKPAVIERTERKEKKTQRESEFGCMD